MHVSRKVHTGNSGQTRIEEAGISADSTAPPDPDTHFTI